MARYAGYVVRLPLTAVTIAKTLIQIKAGASAALEIFDCAIYQTGKIASEQWEVFVCRKSAAATVTSFTPLKLDPNDPASAAVGGTAATGTNASAEGTNTDILDAGGFNILNGEWMRIPVLEKRIWVPAAGIVALVLNTAPAASTNIAAMVSFNEYL